MDNTPPTAKKPRVLLTVSGVVPDTLRDDVAQGRRPRADYHVIEQRTDADILDVRAAQRSSPVVGRVLMRCRLVGPLIGWVAFRRRNDYDVILTDGEQVGIPLALLGRLRGGRRPHHGMIVHIVTTGVKKRLIRWFGLAPLIDRWVTYCAAQTTAIVDMFKSSPDKILQIPFMVDTQFFAPEPRSPSERPMICAVGLERRDYPTLMRAVMNLDVDVVIAAASPWSTKSDSSVGEAVPSNVIIASFSQFELRDLYQRAAFTVMPLFEVDFQAGITAILESMSMGRAVVCSRSSGQTDTILDDVTGIYVPVDDEATLRSAILDLLADPAKADRLGTAARSWVIEKADVEVYAEHFVQLADALRSE